MPSHALSALALLVTLCSCNERSDTPDFGKPATDGIVDIKVDVKGPDQVLLPDTGLLQDMGPDALPGGTWIFTTSGSGVLNYNNVAADKAGNVYVAGSLRDTATFGSTTAGTLGGQSIYVLKLDSNGKLIWVTTAPATDWAYAYGIAVDTQSNTYITGFIRGKATFGSTTLTASGWKFKKADLYVAKMDPKGKFLWATRAGSVAEGDYSKGVGSDKAGNAYITGYFRDTATFGSFTLTASNPGGAFVARLDTMGKFKWVVTCGAAQGGDIAVDSAGSSHVVGVFDKSATFGTHSLTGTQNTTFVAKLSSSGTFTWATAAPGLDWTSIALDGGGNTYVQGAGKSATIEGTVKLAKISKSGKLMWTKPLCHFTGTTLGRTIAVDPLGNAYLGGLYYKSLSCGNTKLPGGGGLYFVKTDSTGNLLWATSADATESEDLVVSGGAVIATGYYGLNARFGSVLVPNVGNGDQLYVWKFGSP